MPDVACRRLVADVRRRSSAAQSNSRFRSDSMNLLAELQSRFRAALAPLVDNADEYIAMVRPSQDPKFGDYQANFAMPLGKQLGRPPRDVAADVVKNLRVDDLCDPPQVEGPGFINLRLKNERIRDELARALGDERLGVEPAKQPRTYVVDFSAPNVAKPMHVGHIRSTVIGAALDRTLRFLGHRVISDNHLGDWGTQFGMIIYGYKHFVDGVAFEKQPVAELTRLYKLVNQLIDYHDANEQLPKLETAVSNLEREIAKQKSVPVSSDKNEVKK